MLTWLNTDSISYIAGVYGRPCETYFAAMSIFLRIQFFFRGNYFFQPLAPHVGSRGESPPWGQGGVTCSLKCGPRQGRVRRLQPDSPCYPFCVCVQRRFSLCEKRLVCSQTEKILNAITCTSSAAYTACCQTSYVRFVFNKHQY